MYLPDELVNDELIYYIKDLKHLKHLISSWEIERTTFNMNKSQIYINCESNYLSNYFFLSSDVFKDIDTFTLWQYNDKLTFKYLKNNIGIKKLNLSYYYENSD